MPSGGASNLKFPRDLGGRLSSPLRLNRLLNPLSYRNMTRARHILNFLVLGIL